MSHTAVSQPAVSQPAVSHNAMSHTAMSQTVSPGHAAGRTAPSWLVTIWAALSALAVCVVTVFYTPIEPPAAWRSTEAVVVSLGRHTLPEDRLTL